MVHYKSQASLCFDLDGFALVALQVCQMFGLYLVAVLPGIIKLIKPCNICNYSSGNELITIATFLKSVAVLEGLVSNLDTERHYVFHYRMSMSIHSGLRRLLGIGKYWYLRILCNFWLTILAWTTIWLLYWSVRTLIQGNIATFNLDRTF